MATIASALFNMPTTEETLKLIERTAVDVNQDWENETTTWTFEDGSKLTMENGDPWKATGYGIATDGANRR